MSKHLSYNKWMEYIKEQNEKFFNEKHCRKLVIDKHQGNTHFSISVFDSYGTEHHLGYHKEVDEKLMWSKAQYIWDNEVKPKKDLLSDAIAECIKLDEERGIEPNLD